MTLGLTGALGKSPRSDVGIVQGLAAPARRCHPALTAVKLVVVGPGFGEAAGERPVAREEVAEHRRGGEEGAGEDRTARQLVEHPIGKEHDSAEEENLKQREEDDESKEEQSP